MSDPEHLKILQQGVGVWNEWRKKNPQLLPDLSDADLDGTDLHGAELIETEFNKADLSGANLFEANLSKGDLAGANLTGAILSRALLIETDLRGASLAESSVYGASVWDIKVIEKRGE